MINRDLQLIKGKGIRVCKTLSPKWDIHIKPPSKLRHLCSTGSRKILRSRGGRWPQGNPFWTQQVRCTHKLTAVYTVCTKPAQAQAQENLTAHSGASDSDGIWEEEEWYSGRVWPLLGQPCSSGGYRSREYGQYKVYLMVLVWFVSFCFFKDTRLGEDGKGHWSRSSWEVVAMIKIHCTKFYKS